MQCKVCEYRLWNLKARRCPECGTPFCVSDYEFVPSSVQFCCPDCGQAYYGTGDKGHLVPEAFTCVKCGRPLHMNDMVLLPAEGLEEEQTQTFRVPWEERKDRGRIRSWFRTVSLAMVSPGKLIRAAPVAGSTEPAWRFMLITSFLIPGIWVVPLAVIMLVVQLISGGGGAIRAPAGALLIYAVAVPVFMALVITVWGIVAHGLLRLTGKTFAGPGRTYQCLCYSSGANALSVIACFPYVGMIWWLISAAVMLKEGQRVHGGRAALAVLTGPLLAGAAVVGLFVSMTMMPRTIRGAGPSSGYTASYSNGTTLNVNGMTLDAARALKLYAGQHGSREPRHALQLLQAGQLKVSDLLMPSSLTAPRDIPVGHTRLDVFQELTSDGQATVVKEVLADLPARIVAHRLGDVVFTYHGIDLMNGDPGLWVAVQWPDPAVNRTPGPMDIVTAYELNGAIFTGPVSMFQKQLSAQNRLRARYKLPPLPDPSTVRHDKPALAPAE